MKIRSCFISNSSSTSFVLITEEDIKLAGKFGMKIYRARDVFSLLKPLSLSFSQPHNIPNFISEDLPGYWSYYCDRLEEIISEHGENVCITEAFDRDDALELGIDFLRFEEDL